MAPVPLCASFFCFVQLLLLLASSPGGASPPPSSPQTFEMPLELDAVRVWLIPELADEPLQELALAVDLAVVERNPGLGLLLDIRTYRIDGGLADRLDRDFGPFAAAALREIRAALQREMTDQLYHELLQSRLLPLEPHLPYRVSPGVMLPLDVEQHLATLAEDFYRSTGRRLLFTSGTRTPETQAEAMLGLLRHGASFRRLYRKRSAAMEIKRAYLRARAQRLDTRQTVTAMAEVIRQQLTRGVYISPHLRAGAVDIRSRNMSRAHKRRLRQAVAAFPNMKLNREERRPPHFHMEVYTKRWPGPCASRTSQRSKRCRAHRAARRRASHLRVTRGAPR